MQAEVAHIGLTPTEGETFKWEGVKWVVGPTEQLSDNLYEIYIKNAETGRGDWYTLTSEMMVAYAMTRRPAS